VVYRLPQIRAAFTLSTSSQLRRAEGPTPQGHLVLVEGEKDADLAWRLGLPATTAGGASDWRPEYAEQIRAANVERVLICPDNDAPGLAYAHQAAEALRGAKIEAAIVTLPGLPEHGDVSDFLTLHGPEALREGLGTLFACMSGAGVQ